MDQEEFKKAVWTYYTTFKREFPWRSNVTPYSVFISEVMLQQTQAGTRTIEKFNAFMKRFPDFTSLANAPLADVLALWQGLGYNRRALALKKAAEMVVHKHGGVLPDDVEALDALPGIGPATARSISAFAFNKPVVFIETNVRSVFIHHFFSGRSEVRDAELLPLVEQTLDRENSREWYSALMDYGTMLKKTLGNASRRSKHYTKQSKFEGSGRQLRGEILRVLTQSSSVKSDELPGLLHRESERVSAIIATLEKEGLISVRDGVIRIA